MQIQLIGFAESWHNKQMSKARQECTRLVYTLKLLPNFYVNKAMIEKL